MAISVFDLFTIGIGPSSSHSIGPMRAARRFVERLRAQNLLNRCAEVEVRLYGSLALTGKGHGTDKALMLGLEGATPEGIDPDEVEPRVAAIRSRGQLTLAGGQTIPWDESKYLVFLRKESLPQHPNGMRFTARDAAGAMLLEYTCFSIGGGFVVDESDAAADLLSRDDTALPYPYRTGDDLLRMAAESGHSVSNMTLANERAWRSEAAIRAGLLERWHVMQACVERGCRQDGTLPGGLKVKRRAPELLRQLSARDRDFPLLPREGPGERSAPLPLTSPRDLLAVMDWVNLFTLDDPRFARLLDLASGRGLVVQLVAWMEDERHFLLSPPVAQVDLEPLAPIVARYSRLKLIVSNSFQTADDKAIRALLPMKQIYFDFARMDDAKQLRSLVKSVSPNRVVFGSCAPLHEVKSIFSKLGEANLAEEERKVIGHNNAANLAQAFKH